MKWIGNLLIWFGLYNIYYISIGRTQWTSSGETFTTLAYALPMIMAGAWMLYEHEGGAQAELEKAVEKLLDQNNKNPEKFYLYLRPFDSTNAYKITSSHLNVFSFEYWERDGFDDIERLIARALRPTAYFIALGKPNEHRGAARILTTEENWQDAVSKLSKQAKLIFILPSFRPGTYWELKNLLRNGWLEKTIFFMPPTNNAWYSSDSLVVEDDWSKTQSAFLNLGLTLPDATPEGALFKLASPEGPMTLMPLPPPNPVAWKKTIQSLIDA